jgi:hypothetical protein
VISLDDHPKARPAGTALARERDALARIIDMPQIRLSELLPWHLDGAV